MESKVNPPPAAVRPVPEKPFDKKPPPMKKHEPDDKPR
jgi:hypothetical protein